MKANIVSGWLALILIAAVPALAQAAKHDRSDDDPPEVCDCRGGGGFPGPFDGSNLHAELADGEMYALDGRVVFQSKGSEAPAPYFEVDLTVHPWLASAVRKADPYYALLGSVSFWKSIAGQRIELSTQAQSGVTVDAVSGIGQYEISLLPLTVYVPACPVK